MVWKQLYRQLDKPVTPQELQQAEKQVEDRYASLQKEAQIQAEKLKVKPLNDSEFLYIPEMDDKTQRIIKKSVQESSGLKEEAKISQIKQKESKIQQEADETENKVYKC